MAIKLEEVLKSHIQSRLKTEYNKVNFELNIIESAESQSSDPI